MLLFILLIINFSSVFVFHQFFSSSSFQSITLVTYTSQHKQLHRCNLITILNTEMTIVPHPHIGLDFLILLLASYGIFLPHFLHHKCLRNSNTPIKPQEHSEVQLCHFCIRLTSSLIMNSPPVYTVPTTYFSSCFNCDSLFT